VFALAAGCSSFADTLGLSPPTHKLLEETKDIRDSAPVPAPVGRELSKELLPAHLIQQGDTLLIQPIELDSPVRLPPEEPVQPDGTIDLGKYGRPIVVGKTLPQLEAQVREIIQAQEPKFAGVTARLVGKPGSVYYVFGEVNAPGSFPVSGRDTVMDGIVAAGGLTKKASRENIVLSRPSPPEGCRYVLPVCWPQIVQLGDTTTNYQLLPGDRIYVPSQGTFDWLCASRNKNGCSACRMPENSCFGYGCNSGCAGASGVGLNAGLGGGLNAGGSNTGRTGTYGVGSSSPFNTGSGSGYGLPTTSSRGTGLNYGNSGTGYGYPPSSYSAPAVNTGMNHNDLGVLPTVPTTTLGNPSPLPGNQ
jgi:protein involved in polysaccharide export with SLBB domain